MYNNFFGFKERPFKLVPNPSYLFLSSSHEEALAHLTYSISQGDGFVAITGEVGTGKTTLCRAFLESLDNDTIAAYIFNPKLTSLQLLKTINDEFGLKSDTKNAKELIDLLNEFLIKKKTAGKRVLIIVDEAQNLSNDVIEQLRLLSNLETTTNKLLQIVLVGQPELGDMLDSYELRQLGQRITLNWHIKPLTFRETADYILHRINIASLKKKVQFARSAFLPIFNYSRGIPRMINILCDRALLTAYGLNRHTISASIVRSAIREMSRKRYSPRFWRIESNRLVWVVSIFCFSLVLIVFILSTNQSQQAAAPIVPKQTFKITPPQPQQTPSPVSLQPDNVPPRDVVEVRKEEKPVVIQQLPLSDILDNDSAFSSREAALKAIFSLWKTEESILNYLNDIDIDRVFFRLAAKQNGLSTLFTNGDLDLLQRLNLPAILVFYYPEATATRYLTLSKMEQDVLTFKGIGDEDAFRASVNDVKQLWSGQIIVPWKNFFSLFGTISEKTRSDSIITLKILLKGLGYEDVTISPEYDVLTQEAIKQIQAKHQITVDGIVGTQTKIILYNDYGSLIIPHIYG